MKASIFRTAKAQILTQGYDVTEIDQATSERNRCHVHCPSAGFEVFGRQYITAWRSA